MKNYLRGTLFLSKNTYLKGVFKIIKGTISERDNNLIRKTYKKDDFLFLEYIIFNYSLYDYYVEELTIGIWIEKDEIFKNKEYFDILSKLNYSKSLHIELLTIKDPLICFCRYLHLTSIQKEAPCFYIDMSINELITYLKIEKRQLNKIIAFLINKNIITRKNKLWIIHNKEDLIKYAFQKDI